MKTALFTNFTDKPFTGYWNGKGRTFDPGQSVYMPDYLAQHFAKHLTNRELLKTDSNGNLVYKGGDTMTSPKRPEDVPVFMELFNKAYTPDNEEDPGEEKDNIDVQIEVANKNRQKRDELGTLPKNQDPTQPQVILPPDFDEDDEDDKFGGKPIEIKVDQNVSQKSDKK